MKRFHIKSLILGIGIGVILTSVTSMIYFAGMDPMAQLDKIQIIAKAREFGMVDSSEIVRSPERSEKIEDGGGTAIPKETTPTQPVESTVEQNTEPAAEPITATIIITPGDTSVAVAQKLLNAGLISNQDEFILQLENLGLTGQINIGQFTFNEATDYREIIRGITGR